MSTVVVFDCDGTLVDSEPLARRAWEVRLGERGYTLTDEDYAAVLGRPYVHTHGFFAERVDLPPHPEFWDLFAETLFELIETSLVPFPDALETIDALREQGVTLAVASSSPRARLNLTLARAGLTDAFEVTVAGDEVAHGKPAPDMYLAAAAGLGVDPSTCVAVEDTGPGVASARAAGMRVVGIARSASDRDLLSGADVVLDRLTADGLLG